MRAELDDLHAPPVEPGLRAQLSVVPVEVVGQRRVEAQGAHRPWTEAEHHAVDHVDRPAASHAVDHAPGHVRASDASHGRRGLPPGEARDAGGSDHSGHGDLGVGERLPHDRPRAHVLEHDVLVQDDRRLEVGHQRELVERAVEPRLRWRIADQRHDQRVRLAHTLDGGFGDRAEASRVTDGHEEGDHAP